MIILLFNGYLIKKVELEDSIKRELFSGVTSTDIKDLPEEFGTIEAGYYVIEELNQYFKLDDKFIQYGGSRSIYFPLWKPNIIHKHLKKVWERQHQEKEAVIMAEITEFNNDLDTPLRSIDGYGILKPYYHSELKTLNITHLFDVDNKDDKIYELYINGLVEVEIHYNKHGYSCYDGFEGYGWHSSIKRAVKTYMDSRYKYPGDESYEPSCSSCGDGGCVHCEPSRFI